MLTTQLTTVSQAITANLATEINVPITQSNMKGGMPQTISKVMRDARASALQ